ncbi:MAG: DUF397 domain-containing protein [Candidatus Scalindua rubra]|uniref:DUF397 domain-containing protein n=1 Tax=Candidatus Scalindua brodae TaxID=237368 RepID=A0A0B0EJ07_9BACT|nr:MAG: hypothetical protein SCABRO_03576 [Candidatus Scalindua brodae]MBZ0108885.1 DUF397 domain-containing protein [Candidatus Scalindua rubra]
MARKNNNLNFIKSSVCPQKFCVEVALGENGVHVRNSVTPSRQIKFNYEEWQAFIKGVKRNEFDFNKI